MTDMDKEIAIALLMMVILFVSMIVLAASEATPECSVTNATDVAHQIIHGETK